MGKKSSNGSFICVEEEDSIKAGKSNKVVEKHVKEGAFALSGTVLETWTVDGGQAQGWQRRCIHPLPWHS